MMSQTRRAGRESWARAAAEYRDACAAHPLGNLTRLRDLPASQRNLARAYAEKAAHHTQNGAAVSTVEALMFSLRERGEHALDESENRQRLRQLNDKQIVEVGDRLQQLKPEIARPWTTDEVKRLPRSRR
jgi:transposase